MNTVVQRGRAVVFCVPVVLAVLGILILPAVMLSMHGAAFLAFVLLLVSALWSMLAGHSALKNQLLAMWRGHRWLILAMAAMPTAMLVSAWLNPAAPRGVPFAYGRLWLFGFVLFGLLQLRPGRLQSVQWGCVAGAIASAARRKPEECAINVTFNDPKCSVFCAGALPKPLFLWHNCRFSTRQVIRRQVARCGISPEHLKRAANWLPQPQGPS